MLSLVKAYNVLSATDLQNIWTDEEHQLLSYRKGGLIFLFNFNPCQSFSEYELPTDEMGEYKIAFNSDEKVFGGQGRIASDYIYHTEKLRNKESKTGVIIYSPSRTVLVLKKVR